MTEPNRVPDLLRRRRLLLALLVVGARAVGRAGPAHAESDTGVRVIVHPSNPQTATSRDFVADAFLKKATRWPHGEPISAVDLRPDNPIRRRFCESFLKRSIGAVRSYWQQRIFSGRDVPPPEVDSDEGVMAHVARYPGAIGYVTGSVKLNGVRELTLK